jgi:Tfp pilus assembly protein PilF
MDDVETFSSLVSELARAVVANPHDAAIRRALAVAANGLGVALHTQGRREDALAAFDRALALDPQYAEAAANAGNLLCELERYMQAYELLSAAAQRQPNDAAIRSGIGIALRGLARPQDAVHAFEAAIAADPAFADAYTNLGATFGELGEFERAEAAFARALDLAPRTPRIYREWSSVHRFTEADASHVAALERLDGVDAHFALGKAYEDLGRHTDAFTHLLAGNAAKRATISYDEAAVLQHLDAIAAHAAPERMRALAGAGDPSRAPIFILGMPRSGTTLIEQVLASHPQVHALGERADLALCVEILERERGVPYPELLGVVDDSDVMALGERYVARTGAAGYARVTDKMPSNFRYAGMIALALPNARIIHTRRDPVDTCISCFAQLFTYANAFTYDLAELGRYYRAYERLMQHWRAVLPDSMMLEVHYEDVVADLETQARRIVEHVGLPWDHRVLEFHRSSNPVRTASIAQVRRPVYATSVGKRQRYGDAIIPLIDALASD